MTRKERIFNKYHGMCAYSGTKLEDDWQIDHKEPVLRNYAKDPKRKDRDNEENMVPCQKIINHYKHSLSLSSFRVWLLGDLHLRLKKFPKKSTSPRTLKRKEYLLRVASYFGISPDVPFNKVFYFEMVEEAKKIFEKWPELDCLYFSPDGKAFILQTEVIAHCGSELGLTETSRYIREIYREDC
jgi:hypothetical protein